MPGERRAGDAVEPRPPLPMAIGRVPHGPRAPPIRIVVVAASAGGLAAFRHVLSALPADLAVPVAIVQHRSVRHPDLLARLLGRWTSLPVKPVAPEGEPILPGVIYIAPPDRHLVVREPAAFATTDGRRIRFVRSCADVLFASAAAAYGPGVLAIVLTGGDGDGADGVRAVKAAGGLVVVQDPTTSAHPGMPSAALATGGVDLVLPLEAIGPAVAALAPRRAPA